MRRDGTSTLNSYDAIQILNDQGLCLSAISSLCRYNDSKGKLSEQEVEILRVEAELQFARLQEFYLRKLGGYAFVHH
ncbi:hypothetical protein D3C85_1226790 [compost metagenome]